MLTSQHVYRVATCHLLFITSPVHIMDEVCCISAPSCEIRQFETTKIINYADYHIVV
jgi:hypothetical protein